MDQSPCFDRFLTALHCEELNRVPPAEIWIDPGNQGYGHHFALIQGRVDRDPAEWRVLTNIHYLYPGHKG